MKLHSLAVPLLTLALGGCSVFQRSPTWDRVVASRSQYSGSEGVGAKDGFINHLHQVLSSAGVEHKVVTYEFHARNVYHEETVETATAVVYRDDTTPRNPWWIMDEFHHVPVWLTNGPLEAQLAFFIQSDVTVVSVHEYGAARAPRTPTARAGEVPHRRIAFTPKPHRHTLFGATPVRVRKQASAAPDPLSATLLGGTSAPPDAQASALFRTTHGTAFDPGSSVDREKMNELRRQLLARHQTVRLRSE